MTLLVATWMRVAVAFLHRWLSDQRNPFYAPAILFALSAHVRCLRRLRLSEWSQCPEKCSTNHFSPHQLWGKKRWKIILRELIELAGGYRRKLEEFSFFFLFHTQQASLERGAIEKLHLRAIDCMAVHSSQRVNDAFELKYLLTNWFPVKILSAEDSFQPQTRHYEWFTREVNPGVNRWLVKSKKLAASRTHSLITRLLGWQRSFAGYQSQVNRPFWPSAGAMTKWLWPVLVAEIFKSNGHTGRFMLGKSAFLFISLVLLPFSPSRAGVLLEIRN